MKVGIITWWRNNYGSILQALALQQKLNQYNDLQYEIICQFGKKATSVDNVFDKIKSVGLAETCKRVFWKVAFKGLRLRNKKMQQFVDENLKVSNRDEIKIHINKIKKKMIKKRVVCEIGGG